jgi:elongation factor Ts
LKSRAQLKIDQEEMAEITAAAVKELREITGVAMMDCKKALVECDGDLEAAQELLRKKGQAKALKKSSRETTEGAITSAASEDGRTVSMVRLSCETDFVARNEKFQALVNQLALQALEQGDQDFMNQPTGEGISVQELITQKIAELGENMQLADVRRVSVKNGVIGSYIHMTGKIGVLVPLETDQPCDDESLQALAKDLAMHIAATPSEAVRADQVDQSAIDKEREVFAAQARESGKPEEIIEKMIGGRVQKFLKEVCVETQPFVKDSQITVGNLVKEKGKALGVAITFDQFVKFQF